MCLYLELFGYMMILLTSTSRALHVTVTPFHLVSWEQNDRISSNFVYSYWQDLSWDCYTSFFAHLYQRYGPWFTSEFGFCLIYIENKLTEFHQILYMQSYWQALGLDCYTSFFAYLFQSYGPWFMPKFHFRSISWEQINRISNFVYKHSYWQDLAWDCCTSFFLHICTKYSMQDFWSRNGPMALVPFICMQKRRFWWVIWNFDGPFGKKDWPKKP